MLGLASSTWDKVSIYAYALPDLKRQTITDLDEGVLHGLQVVDWDGKGREALLGDRFEEALEDCQPVPLAESRQTRMVGQRFSQVVAEVPAQAQSIRHDPHVHAIYLGRGGDS